METNKEIAEAQKAMVMRRAKLWQTCGELSRFKALARNMERRGLISFGLVSRIAFECDLKEEEAKNIYSNARVIHDEFILRMTPKKVPKPRGRPRKNPIS